MGRCEYAVEVYNKYSDGFVEQIDVFCTLEEAECFIENNDVDIDEDSEYFGILKITYDENECEIGTERL